MPEQFEVARMAAYLRDNHLETQRIKALVFPNQGERMLRGHCPKELSALVLNQRLISITTKAKYTYLYFKTGTWVWHYRFTGIPHVKGKAYQDNLYTLFSLPISDTKHNYCRMQIQFDHDQLDYIDTRCLSALQFYPNQNPQETVAYQSCAADLNHDLDPCFASFQEQYGQRKITVKQWLLLQSVAPSGVGNYLACELLAHAKIYPFKAVKDLQKTQYQYLCEAIKAVRKQCEKTPKYDWFLVFNRQDCRRCGREVTKKRLPKNAQTSHFCGFCQKVS
eukprot:COSAG01_NODE_1_length_100484_cov_170.446142_40_plen_278_part_00